MVLKEWLSEDFSQRGQRNNGGKHSQKSPGDSQPAHLPEEKKTKKEAQRRRYLTMLCMSVYVCVCVSDERQLSETEATGVWDTMRNPAHCIMGQLYYGLHFPILHTVEDPSEWERSVFTHTYKLKKLNKIITSG